MKRYRVLIEDDDPRAVGAPRWTAGDEGLRVETRWLGGFDVKLLINGRLLHFMWNEVEEIE